MSDEQTQQGVTDGTRDGQARHGVFEGYDNGEQPLQSYTVLAGVFNLIFAVFVLLTKGTGRRLPERGVGTRDIVLLGVATHKLSDLIANDAVTSFIRAPFTELQEKESPKSVDEEPRGTGFRRSIGELVTCKFCMGQWIASFFTYGLVFSPAVTRLIASIFAVVTLSDHLHQSYKALKNRA
ncbi:DUF1360 domain-containing protein [Rubrobacter marinus]|uniref:DUF1360 domain-containing protein n=1 Tax=Rubrobacter marinus TaxID=2653852 RepID=A0A6G8Q205_9ACTN|nr:DUF1360 domain-containing protein [Rubrobacter marinus]QIN80511.1 DUF1360 domain-containing protein [Rubrobacter marinus]